MGLNGFLVLSFKINLFLLPLAFDAFLLRIYSYCALKIASVGMSGISLPVHTGLIILL